MTDGPAAQPGEAQRLDQWLYFARLTKSRTLAQALIERGKIRVNRVKVDRSSLAVKVGDTLTISVGPRVRIFTVKGFGKRRGPATEAQALFEELTPATDRTKSSDAEKAGTSIDPMGSLITAVRPDGAGRPTKRERRATERLKDRFRES
ncbi:MAG TPA: RNA-binding S4 domain-containing protein [Hyphomicrobium sp.]|nr:RNA-binding S4 domain-containing protein [Hyphomicrobium sp.]